MATALQLVWSFYQGLRNRADNEELVRRIVEALQQLACAIRDSQGTGSQIADAIHDVASAIRETRGPSNIIEFRQRQIDLDNDAA